MRKSTGKTITLRGIGVSPGVVIGPAFLVMTETPKVVKHTIAATKVQGEVARFESALIETRRQIRGLQKDMEERAPGSGSILEAHLLVLDDRSFAGEILKRIRNDRKNAEFIVSEVSDKYASVLLSVQDAYLRERVADIRDVTRRVIRNLLGGARSSLSDIKGRHIVVAPDLAPSETATMRKDMVIGFATNLGSPTSHTAVMARALEIPAVVGLHDVTKQIQTGDEILIDGNKGVFIIRPSAKDLQKYGQVVKVRKHIENELTSLKDRPAETKDKHTVVLSANIEGIEELDAVVQYGAEGVGLFRSEFLYMSRDEAVSEDDQAHAYGVAADTLAPKPVIVRTLDLGGDKFLKSDTEIREPNPYLGCRAIRLMLKRPEDFKSQLRAILRASARGNVKLMYPMITNPEEIVQANVLLRKAMQDLDNAGIKYDKNIEVGAMIEIPSAAMMADEIAKLVSFLSLGTNDLIQYTLAVDRVNDKVSYLYEPTHPAVLRLIKETIDAGHRNNIWVGLCGEMAADPLIAPLLVGMGVDELSVAPSAVPLVKDAIRSVEYSRLTELAEISLACSSASDVLRYCRELTEEVAPELLELV